MDRGKVLSPSIGNTAPLARSAELIARSRARAALIPDLLVEAQRVANTVYAGWHGRKRRGTGEDFWQFRHYTKGENIASIDWRRSAKEKNQFYIRDNELQASQTIWLWVDESPSMLYQSKNAAVSKQSRALVLAFAMAELLSRSGERVGLIGVQPPISHRRAAEQIANALMLAEPQIELDNNHQISDFSNVILFSDFLPKLNGTLGSNEQSTTKALKQFSNKHVRGHLVQIVDPAEESFPFSGRIEFNDPETGEKFISGSAASIKQDYVALFKAHTNSISKMAQQIGWTHTLHHTDQLASKALLNLHMNMSANNTITTSNVSGGL